MRREPTIAVGSIQMHTGLHSGRASYLVTNIKEALGTTSIRHSDTPRQASHGMRGSTPRYGPRTIPIDGQILAGSLSERIAMEEALRRQVALPAQPDADASILVQVQDESGNTMQLYAVPIEDVSFRYTSNPRIVGFGFILYAEDPIFYGTSLQAQTGGESTQTTNYTIQDGALPTLPYGIQDVSTASLSVANAGNIGSPPLIVVHGPTANTTVQDVTTGKAFKLSLSLSSGERVEVDVGSQTVTKYTAAGVASDAKAYFSGDWITVEPGTNVFGILDDTPSDLYAQLEVRVRSTWK